MSFTEDFVKGLERLMATREMNQTELADEAEIGRSTLTRIFQRRGVSMDNAQALAKVFNVTVDGVARLGRAD